MPRHHHSRSQHGSRTPRRTTRGRRAGRSPGSERKAVVGVDPILRDFERDPYDPLYAAQAAGRLTGHALHQRGPRWVRIIALVVAVLFILSILLAAATWIRILG